MAEGPDLTAITVGVRGADSLRGVVAALQRQTVADLIELVVVVPRGAEPPPQVSMWGVRVAALEDMDTPGAAIARGLKLASAPVVAYVEEHSWPAPDWAERLLAAHDGTRTAVGWSVMNANPHTATSWTQLLTDFGRAVHPAIPGAAPKLPWHHTSYRREALLAYGAGLGDMLEAEWRIHADLRARGETLYLEPSARSRHWNVSRPWVQLLTDARGARVFGASRAISGDWSARRRAAYAAAAPLIFALRLRAAAADAQRARPRRPLIVGAMLSLNVLLTTLGEVYGYLAGWGAARRKRAVTELDRATFLTAADQARWENELSNWPDARTGAQETRPWSATSWM